MKVKFARRALADLRRIDGYYKTVAPGLVAAAFGTRIRALVAQLEMQPESAPRSAGPPRLRVAVVTPYPFRLFYRVLSDRIQIVHIRHTSRRQWP